MKISLAWLAAKFNGAFIVEWAKALGNRAFRRRSSCVKDYPCWLLEEYQRIRKESPGFQRRVAGDPTFTYEQLVVQLVESDSPALREDT